MQFDVAVIGASSSGLLAARQLAKAGVNVGVFDRQEKLDPARRTYIITPKLLDILGKIPDNALLHRVHTMQVETSSAQVSIPLRQPDLIVERNLLIKGLAEEARAAGATIHLGHSFLGFETFGEEVRAKFRQPDDLEIVVRAPTLIAADGAFSRVRAALGLAQPAYTSLLQAEITLPQSWDPGVSKVWFDAQKTPYFFWLIPESHGRAVVGLIVDQESRARPLLDEFLSQHQFKALAYQAGKASMYHPQIKSYATEKNMQVYFVGDAAAQVKVTTVGGSVSGFRGAKAAVKALLSGQEYALANQANSKELNLHWLLRSLLHQMNNEDYDQLLKLTNSRIGLFLSETSRDAMAGELWKLLVYQPRFMALAARLIFRRLSPLKNKSMVRDSINAS